MLTSHFKLRYALLLALGASLSTLGSAQVQARIDAGARLTPISKNVYGQFVEQIGSLITSGLWAEMVDDRKFYNPIPNPPSPNSANPRAARMRLRSWEVVGPKGSVTMDSAKPYVGKHSPHISLSEGESHGLEQAGYNLQAGRGYVGRAILSGDSGVKVGVSLIYGSAPSQTQTVQISGLTSGFKKFTFRFKASESASNARFRIAGTGRGSFAVGAVSLMPSDNVNGFRSEVVGVLKQLHSGFYRFPGGNFVSAFEWRDAIGDIDRRTPKFDPVWGAVQSNDVGTDEFMKFCKLIDVEPYITVSAGFGDANSAREYVEYCNGRADTVMGRLRAQNGHPAPYHVKYWGIGNETWGFSYQFGAMRLSQYVYKHNDFADAMRSVDPSIVLVGSGAMQDTMTGSKEALNLGDSIIPKLLGPADWTGGLFLHSLDKMDLISEHFYNYGASHFDLAQQKQVPNDPNEPLSTWMRRPANHIRLKYEEYKAYEELIPALKTKPVPICLDEWAYSGGPPNSYRTAPAFAWAFQEMFRHSDLYQAACFTFATAMFTANGDQAALTPTGLVFKLYRDHFGSVPVKVYGNSPQPKPTDPPGGEQPTVNAGSDTFPLDIAAAYSDERKTFTVAIINPTEEEQTLDLKIEKANLTGKGVLWRMAPSNLNATNVVGRKPEVEIESIPFSQFPGKLILPRYSVNIYEINRE